MNGTLALAAAIATMERHELRALVSARRLAMPGAVRDPLGLALELLRQDSISRALQATDRAGLAALSQLAEEKPADPAVLGRLRSMGLVGIEAETGGFAALPEVEGALRAVAASAAAERAEETRSDADRAADTSGWYGPALTAVRRAAAIVRELAAHPVRLSRKGLVTVGAQRELASAIRGEAEASGRLLAVLEAAGLVARVQAPAEALLVPADGAASWLSASYPDRWIALAAGFAARIDDRVRALLEATDGDLAAATGPVLAREYPLLPEEARAAAAELALSAEEIGFSIGGRLSPPALLALRDDPAARDAAARDFPAEVEGVYLQPDLSLIVPGPLSPADEAALAAISEIEQLGAAASLRLSPASLGRAVRAGFATARIRELLGRLSLTGIPQPLDFLLDDLERTLGGERSSALARERPGRIGAASAGGPRIDDEIGPGSDPAGAGGAASDEQLERLVELVYESARASEGAGELTRRLELAIRHRSPVRVTAAAGSDERVFTLLPVSLNGGRLRATDQLAGVERTLPVSAITAVETA